jgi:arylsulfatase A-like enzyme
VPCTRRTFLSLAAAVSLPAQTPTPNVVFFLTDDHGAWSLPAYGCKETHAPNIDRLAREGTLFTRAYACTPVCSPSRATYYTGRLPSKHGVQDFLLADDSYGPKSHRFLEGQTTFADVLEANGYLCALIGKWHLGDDTSAQSGFDYWCTAPRGGGPYKGVEMFRNGQSIRTEGFKTDLVGDEAVRFLDEHHDKPFCLTVPFFAPHDPFDFQPEQDRAHYKDAAFSCFPEPPGNPQRRERHREYEGNRESKTSYSALISGMDRNVGKVLAKLDDLGLAENTVVIFSADQGYNCGHHGFWGKGNGTIPFTMYEESIRVPLVWRHPGRIAPGKTVTPMVSSYDFFPTLLDYLGIEAAPDPLRVGRSYAEFLRGRAPEWPAELYFEFGYTRAIRTENLKYVERGDGWWNELFDLEDDPGETINRVGKPEYREQRLGLKKRLDGFFQAHGAPDIEDWRSTTTQVLPTDTGYYTWRD